MSKRPNPADGDEPTSKKFKGNGENLPDDKYIGQVVKELCRQQHNLYYQWCQRRLHDDLFSYVPSSSCSLGAHPSTSDETNEKDAIVEIEEPIDEEDTINEDGPSLLILSDDVLLTIFKNLHPLDLLNISRTCVRLNTVSRDRTLWTDIDFSYNPLDKRYTKTVVNYDSFIDFILPNTRSIKKSGLTDAEYAQYSCTAPNTTQVSITSKFIHAVSEKANNLKSVSIENHIVYGPAINIHCFPKSLEHLSFKNSILIRQPNERSYFFQIDRLLPNLRVLDLTGCQWFRSHSFLALSKSSTLKELYLKGCLAIEDCVPYASLASTFGFPSLELLDLRLTHVNDSDVTCFNRVETLKKLYLEAIDCPGAETKITDVSITSFGKQREGHQTDGLCILVGNQPQGKSLLESLILRNYRTITDISLKHAELYLPNLKHLDVRGTCCTENGVDNFKRAKPDVEILTDFNNDSVEESIL